MPDRNDLGIKLREGKVEIKHRTHQYGVLHFHPHAAGYVDAWRKWSFDLATFSADPKPRSPWSDWWIGVRKERWLRRYLVTEIRRVTEVPDGVMIENGCEWELSRIQTEGVEGVWWSTAFEAFGEVSALKDILVEVVGKTFMDISGWEYCAEDSISYPKWLGLIGKELKP
jgi:hypothetical protein